MERSTREPEPVPSHLLGTTVSLRYRHDAGEQVVVGIVDRADGGYVVTDGHRVVPVVESAVVDVRPAGEEPR